MNAGGFDDAAPAPGAPDGAGAKDSATDKDGGADAASAPPDAASADAAPDQPDGAITPASIAHVQNVVQLGSGTSMTGTLSSAVKAGDLLVGVFRGIGTVTVSDSVNGSWTEAFGLNDDYLFYYEDSAAAEASSLVITVKATTSDSLRMSVDEFSGVAKSSALDTQFDRDELRRHELERGDHFLGCRGGARVRGGGDGRERRDLHRPFDGWRRADRRWSGNLRLQRGDLLGVRPLVRSGRSECGRYAGSEQRQRDQRRTDRVPAVRWRAKCQADVLARERRGSTEFVR